MKQYTVTGMSCAACSSRVEKAVSAVEGVTSCSVSLLTNTMAVEGSAESEKIIHAVQNAGYGASVKGEKPAETKHIDREAVTLRRRLIASVVILIPLMYVSMGHVMWGWWLPSFFVDNPVAIGLVQLLLSGLVMIINQRFFISGFRGLIHRSPNMDTLVALGSAASFGYSCVVLFAMTRGESHFAHVHEFYFESAAMILALITVGKMLEARSKGKTTDALKNLMKLAPQTAVLLKDGKEITVPIDQVQKGDIFVLRPGDSIPVDGIVRKGSSAVNESALSGESIPVDKGIGDRVSAATMNQSGYLECEAVRVGEDTTLSQIIRMVSDAAATKAPIAKVADRVSGVFVPIVMGIAVVTILAWLLLGREIGFALARGISVLVISCPCALGLATPVAIMVGNGVGAKNGILFKTAAALEQAGKTEIVVLDKTGTVTSGEPVVTDILAGEGYTEDALLTLAYALEKNSEHPLAKAIVKHAEGRSVGEVTEFEVFPGNGLRAELNGKKLIGGNAAFVSAYVNLPDFAAKSAAELSTEGKTPLFFCEDHSFAGIIAVADTVKEDSAEAIKAMEQMGIEVVMLTGDNEVTAKAIGRKVGVERIVAGVRPDGKEAVIRDLQKKGKVAMVGDGINDAPALTRADVGIAIGAGTDVAIDAADVVLMKSRLSDVPAAIRLSRFTLRNIHENLFWAFIYNIFGIPLAAGLYISLLGWQLNPMFGAAAMSLSSFCVVSNALRLNFCRIHDGSKDKKRNYKKEKKSMEKTMKIEGMMCGHCSGRVKKVLEAMPEVASAEVSHENGTAVVTLSAPISDEALKAVVEAQEYRVISIA